MTDTKIARILCGPSGIGKSTDALESVADLPIDQYAMVSADNHFYDDEGVYNFDPNELPRAHAACLRNFISACQMGLPLVICDNTNTTIGEIAPYQAVAAAYGYEVRIEAFIAASLTELHILAQRNQHGVPLNTVVLQQARLEDTIKDAPPWWNIQTTEVRS
jgi:hypothetical protein